MRSKKWESSSESDEEDQFSKRTKMADSDDEDDWDKVEKDREQDIKERDELNLYKMGEECRSLNDCLQQLTSNDINISNQKLNKIVDTCILLLYSEGESPGSKADIAPCIFHVLHCV